jgi:hypothetical protein
MITAVRRIFLEVVEQALRHLCGWGPIKTRFGTISTLHRFGSSMNPHVYFHCCVTDGLFSAEADDGDGLERWLRYCARPIFAMERLTWVAQDHNRLVYPLPKPMPDGRSQHSFADDGNGWRAVA